ncbi:MAG: citramalate synthase [Bifidobacteriaceae bacterium]|jgi:2-isopropylmalate synthase|nr:citramalate synthase [Bifidobacteriaceae bacterium]
MSTVDAPGIDSSEPQHVNRLTDKRERLTFASIACTRFDIYDTTLRDGAQQEGINLSVADKLAIATLLDELGVGYIEGGWPGAIPKDTEFFARAGKELRLTTATLAAFGSTRRPGGAASTDEQVRALLDAETPVITLVAKSDIRHVERALRTTPEENLAMIADTVAHLVSRDRRVFLDAEHFFDGFTTDPAYALACVNAAADAGADTVVLCDTNGGMLPHDVGRIVGRVASATSVPLGIHAHNDTGCAVANSMAAIVHGARHAQGTINGYGERTGNADLTAIIGNLEVKLARRVLPVGRLAELTRISHAISEIANQSPLQRQPYVGASAFAHKAGLHASAIRVDPDLYQHADPVAVGNDMRMLVSEMAGRATIELKGRELGFDLAGHPDVLSRITGRVKDAEAAGYTYDAADASFELLLREELTGARPVFFTTESWRTVSELAGGRGEEAVTEATVKVHAGDRRLVAVGEGNGPVNALDRALRGGLIAVYPELERIALVDFKVRILDSSWGTDAVTRVLIESTDSMSTWRTVGVGPNIIEASWEALVDSLDYGLIHMGVRPR